MSPPESIAHYRIVSKLGEGGMGAVYRATDTKLNRDVALKVLPDAFAADSARMLRFEREAQVLASLNHPNIAQIYGVERGAIIMELVEGPDLSGPLPLDTVLDYARQIAAGLEAAHERGVVHRDLKPANIKVTSTGSIKILDFGLAKTSEPAPASGSNASPTLSPTLSLAMTQPGMILGTAAYMSPEQARGQATDKRADIWSFGVVLYELITGRLPFRGDDLSHTMAAVIMQEPSFDGIPPRVERLLKACLEKDPKKRLRDIGDFWRLLDEESFSETPAAAPAVRSRLAWAGWAVAGLALAATAGMAFIRFREQPAEQPVTRFEIALAKRAETAVIGSADVSISPDGRQIASIVNEIGASEYMTLRPLDSFEDRMLPGTEGARSPFWSPDSRFIAFRALRQLKVIDSRGGPARLVTDVDAFRGGTWSSAGDILFVSSGALWLIRNVGGTPSKIPLGSITMPAFPGFLPDQRHFVVTSTSPDGGVFLGSIDSRDPENRQPRRLVTDVSKAIVTSFGPAGSLALLFVRNTTLMALPLDPSSLEAGKDAYPVAERVGGGTSNGQRFTASAIGHLVYQEEDPSGRKMTWYDRQGKVLGTVGEPGDYRSLSLSPDGTRVLVDKRDDADNADIWVYDLVRNSKARITSDLASETNPVWSPDGQWIAFNSTQTGVQSLYRKAASGAGTGELLAKGAVLHLYDWSRDGKTLLVASTPNRDASRDLYAIAAEGEHKPTPLVTTRFRDDQGRFSPDGKFIAYKSNETGRDEIYVQPATPGTTERWTISQGHGTQPRWSRDGRQLYYMSLTKLMVVDVQTSPFFRAGIPKELFTTALRGGGGQCFRALGHDPGWPALSHGHRGVECPFALESRAELARCYPQVAVSGAGHCGKSVTRGRPMALTSPSGGWYMLAGCRAWPLAWRSAGFRRRWASACSPG